MDEEQNRQKGCKSKAAIEAQQPPRPASSSMASPTKKLASVAASFIRAVFCSPVKNEQKSIRKLSNPEAAARTTMSTSSSGENGGHGGEQVELEHVPEMIGISYQVNRRHIIRRRTPSLSTPHRASDIQVDLAHSLGRWDHPRARLTFRRCSPTSPSQYTGHAQ